MHDDFHYILPDEEGFKDELLDIYLAAGYYRMQHFIFTTSLTPINASGDPLPVFWLRTQVNDIIESGTSRAILKKCSRFHIKVSKAIVSAETEALYHVYRSHIDFNASDSCSQYLHQPEIPNPFNSKMIEVRDGDKLVAVGYFDLGKKAIAGIINFYHPDYRQFSLGKFLMLQKIAYARSKKIALYYTGYLSTAITKFDYKLFPDTGAIEVFLPVPGIWVPYKASGKEMLVKYVELYHQPGKE
jgi:leucyl-tRNA---protein transferase